MTASALVEEATRRSAVVWVELDGGDRPRAVWHLWHDGRAWLVTGGSEQPLPGAGTATRAVVAVRSKDRQADRLVQWVADVARVEPGSQDWDEVVPLLHAQRLNAPDGDQQPARWARESVVLRLTPTGEEVATEGDDWSAVPPCSRATTQPSATAPR